MNQSDLSLALLTLGLWIDRMEKWGNKDNMLMQYKHAYLRINWWMLKNPSFRVIPSPTEEEWQRLQESTKDGEFVPSFLPCHKLPLHNHHLPCNSHSKSCHCAQKLQCELTEDISFSYNLSPNVSAQARAARGASLCSRGLGCMVDDHTTTIQIASR